MLYELPDRDAKKGDAERGLEMDAASLLLEARQLDETQDVIDNGGVGTITMGSSTMIDAPILLQGDVSLAQDGGIIKTIKESAPSDDAPRPPPGSKVTIHYTGMLQSSGMQFDTSIGAGQPFTFTIGRGEVIKGWEEAIPSMKVGERATLEVRSDYAYGSKANGHGSYRAVMVDYNVPLQHAGVRCRVAGV